MKYLILKSLFRFGIEKGLKSNKPKYTGLKVLAIALFFIAIIFSLIALHQILSVYYSPIHANLYFSLGFAVLSLIMLLTVYFKKKSNSTVQFSSNDDIVSVVSQKTNEISTNMQKSINRNTGKALLFAAVAGLILGSRRAKK